MSGLREEMEGHRPGRRTREHKAIAVWLNGMTNLLFSRSTKDAKWDKTRILSVLDPQEINWIKKELGQGHHQPNNPQLRLHHDDPAGSKSSIGFPSGSSN
jgi:hypothetical protein